MNTATVSETIFGTGTTADSVGIGDYAHTNAEPYSGFISNIRILKGTALYTSNFTPPTRTLTNVTNTKLLCCQSNTSATAAAVTPGSITANGNAAATNFNPFTTDITQFVDKRLVIVLGTHLIELQARQLFLLTET